VSSTARRAVGVALVLVLATIALLMRSCVGLNEEQRAQIQAWLECDDCLSGELDSVVGMGSRAIPALAAYLSDGPSRERLQALQRYLETVHRQLSLLSTDSGGSPYLPTRREFISEYLARYREMYQVRAAIAVGEIGGKKAKGTLGALLAKPGLPVEVLVRVRHIHDSVLQQ